MSFMYIRDRLRPVTNTEKLVAQLHAPVRAPVLLPPDVAAKPAGPSGPRSQGGHGHRRGHRVHRVPDGAGDGDADGDDEEEDDAALLVLVDDLAAFAADLYLDGKLSADPKQREVIP